MEPQLEAQQPEKNNFSWKRVAKAVGLIVIFAAVISGIYFFANLRPVKMAWAAAVLNRHEYYMDCDDLSFYPQVQKIMKQHSDVIEKIKAAGAKDVEPEQINCPSLLGNSYFIKGDVLITYQTRSQRLAIEKLIGDNFFGLQWRGLPVNN